MSYEDQLIREMTTDPSQQEIDDREETVLEPEPVVPNESTETDGAYVEESNDPANYANPLFIVHYPDGHTFSTMQKQVAQRLADAFNSKP